MSKFSMVANIKGERVNEALVNLALPRARLSDKGTLAARVSRLQAYYDSLGQKLISCDCGGRSPASEKDACPFCGDTDEIQPAQQDLTVAEPTINKTTKGKTKMAKEPKEETSASVALATKPEEEPLTVVLDEGELNRSVDRINGYKADFHGAAWELGRELGELHKTQLWKARQEDGKQKYPTWNEFVQTECKISPTYAYKLIDVAKEFSKEQVIAIGATKLHFSLTVPEGQRAKLVQAAEAGATTRELAQQADEIGRVQRNTGRGELGGGSKLRKHVDEDLPTEEQIAELQAKGPDRNHNATPPKHVAKDDQQIMLAALLARQEVKACSKGDEEKPVILPIDFAKFIRKVEPVFQETLVNGIVQRVYLSVDPDNRLIAMVERRKHQHVPKKEK